MKPLILLTIIIFASTGCVTMAGSAEKLAEKDTELLMANGCRISSLDRRGKFARKIVCQTSTD